MEKNLSNCLKKQELHKYNIKYDIIGDSIQFHIFKKKIIPEKIIQNKKVFKITYLSKQYHIDGFIIITNKNKIEKVLISGYHPNCDYKNLEFCLSDNKKNEYITIELIEAILSNLKTYYLDNCYFTPRYKDMKYEEIDSIFVNMGTKEEVTWNNMMIGQKNI